VSTQIEVLGFDRGRTHYVFNLYLTGDDADLAIPVEGDPVGVKLSAADILEFNAGTMVQQRDSKPTAADTPLATIGAWLETKYGTWSTKRLDEIRGSRRLTGWWWNGTDWSQGAV